MTYCVLNLSLCLKFLLTLFYWKPFKVTILLCNAIYWYFCIKFSLLECKSSKIHAVHITPVSSSSPVVFLHHRRMGHQTLESDRGKGRKGEQMTVWSPSLPHLGNKGSRAEQFHFLLAPVNWGAALNSLLVPQVNTRSHLPPQPAMLPPSRYWIIQAVGSISRRKGSNSLTCSLQEFGPSAPKPPACLLGSEQTSLLQELWC